MFESEDTERGIPAPLVRPTSGKAAKASLDQARQFLQDHHIPAAANYTRAAFEMALKSFCERFGVPVAFKADPRHLDTDNLLSGVEAWLKSHGAKTCLADVIERVKLFRKVVLNPYSHSTPPNIAKAEVEGAIAAVENLLKVTDKGGMDGKPLEAAQALIAQTPPSTEEMQAALGFLRAAFLSGLRSFCERKHVRIPYRELAIEGQALWKIVKADRANLFPPPHVGVFDQIDAEHRWLIDPIKEADLATLSFFDLVRIAEVLAPAGSAVLALDSI